MKQIILTYGAIAGLVVIGTMVTGIVTGSNIMTSEWFGYLIMLVALSLIFIGIKRYRDTELGGVIRFGQAFLMGLGIAAVAGVVYVLVWEVYLAASDYAFIESYTQGVIESKKAAGISGDELQAVIANMESMKEMYHNPLMRLPMTFAEIFPVGLLVSLLSAALLRNPRVLPAQA